MLKKSELKYREKVLDKTKELYTLDPLSWYQSPEWLGDIKHILWHLYPEYENHSWDGDINPLHQAWESIALKQKWTGIHSASATGKTYIAATIAYWFLRVFEGSKVIIVGPTEKQIKKNIWVELEKQFSQFVRIFPEAKFMDRGIFVEKRKDGGGYRKDWTCYYLVAPKGSGQQENDAAKGIHGKDVLVILEEITGIDPAILTTIQNTLTAKNNLILSLGNPKAKNDALYKFCKLLRVNSFHVSAYDHPNVVCNKGVEFVADDEEIIPGAVTRASIQEKMERLGKDNPIFKAQVRGYFYEQDEDSLIDIEKFRSIFNCKVVQKGSEEETKCIESGTNYIYQDRLSRNAKGIDPAASQNGDKACIVSGESNIVKRINTFQCPKASHIAYNVIYGPAYCRSQGYYVYDTWYLRDSSKPRVYEQNIGIDSVGVGTSTIETFENEGYKNVKPMKGGEKKECLPENLWGTYLNFRAQAYCELAKDVDQRDFCINIEDKQLEEKLIEQAMNIQQFVKGDKTQITPKSELKLLANGESPNELDALVYWNWVRKSRIYKSGAGNVSV